MRSVRFNRAQYANNFKRSHHASEQSAYPVFKAALNEQVKPVAEYLSKYGVPSSELIDILIPRQPMQTAYRKVYEQVGVKFAKLQYRWINQAALGRKADDDFFNANWRRLMIAFYENESAERIAEVTETTKEEVRKLLAEATAQGLTLSETATYLLNKLQSPSFNRQRALRIARTETTTAANKGALVGAADSDYEVGKCWIKIVDKNTRPTHMAMDAENVIGIDEDFIVGGELLSYPGDVRGSAKEVIQCRCSCAVVPLVTADGLPILKVL